jgi:DNA topoisomerase I
LRRGANRLAIVYLFLRQDLGKLVHPMSNGTATKEPSAAPGDPASVARDCAKSAGLKYLVDNVPGIRRQSRGRGLAYRSPGGKSIRDAETLARIRALAIPPAWTDVWIAPVANAHLQATGRDAKGRKQYRYHARWRESRDESKYDKLLLFAGVLPRIRRRVDRDLCRPGLPREKVLATVVKLLESTLIRVGNDEYAQQNNSFGLTTMRDRHVDVNRGKILFHFRGKSGIDHTLDLRSPRLARIVKRCQDLPGQELFQYLDDDGQVHDIGSADVNDYLREITGENISAKDFRTWAGTALAARALQEFEDFDSGARAKRNITQAIERVAERLGNTKTVCRKCYVHPAVIDAYLDRSLMDIVRRQTERELRRGLVHLKPEEAVVLVLLQDRMKRELKPGRKTRPSAPRSRIRLKTPQRRLSA